MKVGILISCRMDGRGMAGKPLAPILGRPVISHAVDLLRRHPIPSADAVPVILHTTDRPVDDPL